MSLAREGRLDDRRAGLGQAQVLLVKEALEPFQGFLRARVQGRPSMRPGLTVRLP
jgi:hypothetical protein